MRFNKHWDVEGKHAFLGASKHHWINYDLEKLERIWENQFKSQRGDRLHKIAALLISEGIRMKDDNQTLNAYVNDGIRYRMTPEQVLKYSDNCFGTADTISFSKGVLRVHDLKTGIHPGHPNQLKIYCALFCLEYDVNPYDIEMIGRIYQSDEIFEFLFDPAPIDAEGQPGISGIMETIKISDKRIEEMKEVMM